MKRREFLQKSAIVVAGAAAAASGVTVVAHADTKWTSGLKTLSPHEGETLLKMSRQIYPHDKLDDTYYVKVVQDLDVEAGKKPETAKLLHDGVAQLDRGSGPKFADKSDAQQTAALKKIDTTPFFKKVQGTALVSLYNNNAVWKRFAYLGASYPIGGYLHHGFNDLKWLPDPPEEASPKPA
jgi:hypothetical protein